ncbi:MAG: hypothetical protein MJ121_04525 [Clostridia bacterium]|nr:hypothetical protein [Clostridia bacterium]MCQ2481363.1 hypothetical protein [Clostridia bacterium]
MKKLISLLLALISVFTICLVPAYADDTNEIDETDIFSDDVFNNVIIIFDEKYVKFGEDIKITLEYYDGTKVEWKKIDCFSELYKFQDEEGTRLVIILKDLDDTSVKSFTLAENIVFDAQGNGNKTKSLGSGYRSFSDSSHSAKIEYKYLNGDEIAYTTVLPGDFYVNGELVAKNTYEYKLKIDAIKEYKVTVKVHSADILVEYFDSADYKKWEKEYAAENLGKSLLSTLLSPVTVLLSPLMMIFPALGIAGLSSPILSIMGVFMFTFEYLRLTFMR